MKEFIKPAKPGLIVRDPATGTPLPEEGAEKELTSYWLRRKRDGDVVAVNKPKKQPAKKSAKTADADLSTKTG